MHSSLGRPAELGHFFAWDVGIDNLDFLAPVTKVGVLSLGTLPELTDLSGASDIEIGEIYIENIAATEFPVFSNFVNGQSLVLRQLQISNLSAFTLLETL